MVNYCKIWNFQKGESIFNYNALLSTSISYVHIFCKYYMYMYIFSLGELITSQLVLEAISEWRDIRIGSGVPVGTGLSWPWSGRGHSDGHSSPLGPGTSCRGWSWTLSLFYQTRLNNSNQLLNMLVKNSSFQRIQFYPPNLRIVFETYWINELWYNKSKSLVFGASL